jgi:hypothetical protein
MRAIEFIAEQDGAIGKRRQAATVGLNTFSDGERTSSDYTLNRVMMAVAMADGSNDSIDMDAKSWIGKKRSAHPYTDVEQRMLKQAYKAAGAKWTDINNGDLDSEEVKSTNTQSPVQAFKGYPR